MNTMMVVIMVSRRVGQVTLAVSERTSCRNLNGLKAIAVPRPLPDVLNVKRETGRSRLAQAFVCPTLCDEGGAGKAGSIVRGFLLPRRISAFSDGPAAGGGYLLRQAPKVKVGCGEIKGLAGKNSAGRSGRARTCDPRFWRPVLYQLSYTPKDPRKPKRSAPFQA